MMAYRMTMFMVFFNLSMGITTIVISPLIFPGTNLGIEEKNTSYLKDSIDIYSSITVSGNSMSDVGKILKIALVGALLALFAFSLLIPTIPLVALFFSYNAILTVYYLRELHLPEYIVTPLTLGVIIITFIGMSQYMARNTVQGA